jgi:DNA-binding SARP family transcriptional activator/tetratricopeptide (TPR) repeat protein
VLVGVLGPPAVFGPSGREILGGRRQAGLLSLLATRPGERISRDQLEHELWLSKPVSDAALRVVVKRIRAQLLKARGGDLVRAEGRGYLLDCAPEAVDAGRFAILAAEVVEADHRHDDASIIGAGRAADRLWSGSPFDGVDDLPTLQAEATRLRTVRAAVNEAWGASLIRTGDLVGAEAVLEALTEMDPYRETGWALLMVAQYRGRRQAAALASFQGLRRLLDEELGLGPSPELAELEGAILRGDPPDRVGTDLLARPPASAASPDVEGRRPASAARRAADGVRHHWVDQLARPRIDVLGPPALRPSGATTPVSGLAGRLLAALVARRPGIARARLADVVGERSSAGVDQALDELERLLAAIPGGPALLSGAAVSLDLKGWLTDADLVVSLHRAASESAHLPATAVELLDRALALWRGPGFTVDGLAIELVADRFARLRLDIEDDHTQALIDAGDLGRAEDLVRRRVEAVPARERRWAQLMTVQALRGRSGDALSSFQRARLVLAEELGLEPGRDLDATRLAVLTREIGLAGDTAHSDHGGPPLRPPLPSTPIVGRGAELELAEEGIGSRRAVSIIGAPGVGKSRLAEEIAARAQAAGVAVAWAALPSADRAALADALGAWTRRHPGGLVVLDAADADETTARRLAHAVRAAAPQAGLVVTARGPVGIGGGVVPLRPLGLPVGDDTESIESSEAVVLFRQLCVMTAPNAVVPPNVAGEICRRTGGLPVAIRLAAEQARTVPKSELAALAPTSPDLHDAVVEALERLHGDVGNLFAALSVVAGAFDMEIAHALLGRDESAAQRALSTLVDHGLVELDVESDWAPYSLIAPFREIADLLLRGDERCAVLDRLATYCIDLARRRGRSDATADLLEPLRSALPRELSWHERAMAYLADRHDAESAATLAATLNGPLYVTGRWSELRTLIDEALAIPGRPSPARARAMMLRGRPGLLHEMDEECLEAALVLADEAGAGRVRATTTLFLGIAAWWRGEYERALDLLDQAGAHADADAYTRSEARKYGGVALVSAGSVALGFERLGEEVERLEHDERLRWNAAHARMYLGHCRRHVGDNRAALVDLGFASAVWDELDNTASAIHTHAGLAEVYADLQDHRPALHHAARAVQLADAGTIDVYVPWVLCTIARVHAVEGDRIAARTAALEAVRLAPRVWEGERHRIAADLAWVAVTLGETEAARGLLAIADAAEDRRELPFRSPGEGERLQWVRRSLAGTRATAPPTSSPGATLLEAAGGLVRVDLAAADPS